MTITSKTIVILLTLIFAAVILRPKLFPRQTQTPQQFEPKEDSQGNVTVQVTPKQLTGGQPIIFEVIFDTHSVNLDFDVNKITQLINNQGTSYNTPSWEGAPPGGHHRTGILSFPPLPQNTKSVTLTFANIAAIPLRTFSWDVVR